MHKSHTVPYWKHSIKMDPKCWFFTDWVL